MRVTDDEETVAPPLRRACSCPNVTAERDDAGTLMEIVSPVGGRDGILEAVHAKAHVPGSLDVGSARDRHRARRTRNHDREGPARIAPSGPKQDVDRVLIPLGKLAHPVQPGVNMLRPDHEGRLPLLREPLDLIPDVAVSETHPAARRRRDLRPLVLRRCGRVREGAVVVAPHDRRAEILEAAVHGPDLRVLRDRLEHLVGNHAIRRVLPPEVEPVAALKDLDPGGHFEDVEQRQEEFEAVEVIVREMAHPVGADPMQVGDEDAESRIVLETEIPIDVTVHEKDLEASEQRLQEVVLVCHARPLCRPRRGSLSNESRAIPPVDPARARG